MPEALGYIFMTRKHMTTRQPSSAPDDESLCLWCPPITTALLCALQQRAPICLSYPARARELGPVECRLVHMDRDCTTLLCRTDSLPPSVPQECSLYFKIREPRGESPAAGSDLRLPLSAGDLRLATQERLTGRRFGFYCRTSVMDVIPLADEAGTAWPGGGGRLLTLRLKTPFRCVQRELRRHARLFPAPSDLLAACFWFAPVLPTEGSVMLHSIARYTPEMKARTEIVDISAGGAFVRLHHDPLLKDVHIDAATLMLLYLSLADAREHTVDVLAAARCVSVSRERHEMSANLHMRFFRHAVMPLREGPIHWLSLDDGRGIPALDRWLARQRAADGMRGVFRA